MGEKFLGTVLVAMNPKTWKWVASVWRDSFGCCTDDPETEQQWIARMRERGCVVAVIDRYKGDEFTLPPNNTSPREAELEAKRQELENWKRHATELLMADKFKIDQLQARVKLLEGLLHDAYPKVGPELAIAILEALRHETSEEVK